MREYRPWVTSRLAWGVIEKEFPNCNLASVRIASPTTVMPPAAICKGVQGAIWIAAIIRIVIAIGGTKVTKAAPAFILDSDVSLLSCDIKRQISTLYEPVYTSAITSISTRTSLGSRATSTVARAGGADFQNFP